MEVWEVAVLLGVGTEDGPAIPGVLMLSRSTNSDGDEDVTLTHDSVLDDLTRDFQRYAAKIPGAE